jgi:hypothetical protein
MIASLLSPHPVMVAHAALTTEDMSPTPRAARVLRGENHYLTMTAFVISRRKESALAMPASLTTELAELVMDLQTALGPHPRLQDAAELIERINQAQLNAARILRNGELSDWRKRQTREVAR